MDTLNAYFPRRKLPEKPTTWLVGRLLVLATMSGGLAGMFGTAQLWAAEAVNEPLAEMLATPTGAAENTTDAIAVARELYRAGDMGGAIQACGREIAQGPRVADAYCLRGTIYRALGDIEKALTDLTAAIASYDRRQPAVAKKLWQAYIERGDAYRQINELEKAEADYTAATELDALHTVAYARRCQVRLEKVSQLKTEAESCHLRAEQLTREVESLRRVPERIAELEKNRDKAEADRKEARESVTLAEQELRAAAEAVDRSREEYERAAANLTDAIQQRRAPQEIQRLREVRDEATLARYRRDEEVARLKRALMAALNRAQIAEQAFQVTQQELANLREVNEATALREGMIADAENEAKQLTERAKQLLEAAAKVEEEAKADYAKSAPPSLPREKQQDLAALAEAGMVRVSCAGTGNVFSLRLRIENLTAEPLAFVVRPGTRFVANGPHQDMLATGSTMIRVPLAGAWTGTIGAVGANGARPVPRRESYFSAIHPPSPTMAAFFVAAAQVYLEPNVELLRRANQIRWEVVLQTAMWAMTNNFGPTEVQERLGADMPNKNEVAVADEIRNRAQQARGPRF
jgi:tetratricopeptide (TPR) repeat protein